MRRVTERLERVDRAAVSLMARWSVPLLRWALGITYLWFGALKIFGVSPVSGLVEEMTVGLPKKRFVQLVGVWEVAVGIALLLRLALRLTLLLYFLQLAGTFGLLLRAPRVTFQRGNPLLLTQSGEFIIKNLVLLAGGLVVGSTVRLSREEIQPASGEPATAREEARISAGAAR